MLLDDAIEDWGVANRATLSGSDVEMLRRVWSTVRVSDCADLEIGKMEAKDRKNVMILFDKSDRAGVASTLDKVTRWARTQTGPAQTRPGQTRATGFGPPDPSAAKDLFSFLRCRSWCARCR